jgi:hypothetical protein
MITKNDIKAVFDKYKNERSPWKVGMFGIPVDDVTIPFCYDLECFYNDTLAYYPENESLLPEHIEDLKSILKNEVTPNSRNSAAVNLYESMCNLVNAKSEMAALR